MVSFSVIGLRYPRGAFRDGGFALMFAVPVREFEQNARAEVYGTAAVCLDDLLVPRQEIETR